MTESLSRIEFELQKFKEIQKMEIMRFYGTLTFPTNLSASHMLCGIFGVSDSQLGAAIYNCENEKKLNFAYDLVEKWVSSEVYHLQKVD
jgi:hypothetical protein